MGSGGEKNMKRPKRPTRTWFLAKWLRENDPILPYLSARTIARVAFGAGQRAEASRIQLNKRRKGNG